MSELSSVSIDLRPGFQLSQAEKNPILAMSHATLVTSVAADSPTPVKNDKTLEVLTKSCPTCHLKAVVSRGAGFRKSVSQVLNVHSRFIKFFPTL